MHHLAVMYPFLRMTAHLLRARRAAALPILGTDVTAMRCWPTDIDLFMEMNNGRILTLYDIGRFNLSVRTGLLRVLRKERWGLVVAGASVRYRARIRPFQRFEIRTRVLGWDARFVYLEQAMWRDKTCCSNLLIRTGVTERGRLVASERVTAALGIDGPPPELPDWARAWIEADETRPWPPGL